MSLLKIAQQLLVENDIKDLKAKIFFNYLGEMEDNNNKILRQKSSSTTSVRSRIGGLGVAPLVDVDRQVDLVRS